MTARDTRGQFMPGNSTGTGNPFGRRVARLRTVFLDSITEDDVRAVVCALVERAKGGDMVAIRELLCRLYGKPVDEQSPDKVALDAARIDAETAKAARELASAEHDAQVSRLWNGSA